MLVTSQVPVGFTRDLETEWLLSNPTLTFAYSPENLRLGHALEAFRAPERIVIGLGKGVDQVLLEQLLGGLSHELIWMSLESAEMTKHAINSFLATSVAYANELGRICEYVGADMREVECGLKSEPRIGQRAYVAAGPPIAGGRWPATSPSWIAWQESTVWGHPCFMRFAKATPCTGPGHSITCSGHWRGFVPQCGSPRPHLQTRHRYATALGGR